MISGIVAATGQTCVAGSRLLVQRQVYDEEVSKVVEMARIARLGDPSDLATQVGPITTRPQFDKVLRYIESAKREGATCLLGGGPATYVECGDGWFVEPTVFSNVTPQMEVAREEVFGPVLAAIPFDDEDDAVQIANSLPYDLAAGVWTENIARALTMSKRLEAGTVWINTHRAVSYLAPFGALQAIRHRARKRHGDDQGISADQMRLDRHGQRRAQPLCAALRRSLPIKERS